MSYQQYKICQERKHQKSGKTISDNKGLWNICKFCGTQFRYVTKVEEQRVPKK